MKRFCMLVFVSATWLSEVAFAQRAMTVAQVRGFIQSSVEAKLSDKEVADLLKKIRLTEKLDDKAVSELVSIGAGPRTSEALRELEAASAKLPPPASAAPVVKPSSVRMVEMVTEPNADQQKEILLETR
ncbi:MAG TPA: hypothetical protein VKS01_01515, partial [Bryobacteraceae bacterium]|nr:hypothetical protein [Bryobacteraceae bacterium]